MPVTFAPDALIPESLIAARSLTQLNRISTFARASLGDYEKGSFEVGDTVKFRRPKISEAQEYDPRTGTGLNFAQPGYITGELKLEKLLANGFPIYGSDFKIDQYVKDFSDQLALSLGTKFDEHLYGKYRTPSHTPTGEVAYSTNPPIACVATEDAQGNLVDFNRNVLISASTVMERNDVPPSERYAMLSATAKGAFVGESIPVDAGYLEAIAGSASFLQNGLPIGQFAPRHGFLVGGSNTIGSQLGSDDLDSSASAQPNLAIASAAADTGNGGNPFFLAGDYAAQKSLGAIVLTLTTTGNLQNVAVGDIARIGPTNGPAKAWGVILRVNLPGKQVVLVPFSSKGAQLVPAQINLATDRFSIPLIPSISIAAHREALVYSSREMAAPSEGSGARVTTQINPQTMIAMQVWAGSYNVNQFKEHRNATIMIGAKLTDYRKAVLMFSL